MNLRKILLPLFVCTLVLAGTANAGNLFVLPSGTGNPVVVTFSDGLQPTGSFTAPAGTFQALSTNDGSKAILLARSAQTIANQPQTAAVSFINIQNGQISGTLRSINLNSQGVQAAALTPDGTKLLVTTATAPGSMYVIDVASETVIGGLPVTIQNQPHDVAASNDSRYAFVLSQGFSGGLLTVVDLTNNQVISTSNLPGNVSNISVAPFGSVYVTTLYQMLEFDSQPPFAKLATSGVTSQPGKFQFSPDGRYAITTNELLNGSSILTMDFQTRGPQTPAGAQISAAAVTQGFTQIVKLDSLNVISSTQAIGYSTATQKMYLIGYPTLTVTDLAIAGVGVPAGVAGYDLTDEFPTPHLLYYAAGSQIIRYDMTLNQVNGTAPTNIIGPLNLVAAPSQGDPNQAYPYNDKQTVGPGVAIRPYGIRITDIGGRPVFNATVSFTAVSSGVTVLTPAATTNRDGYASVQVTSPTTNGDFIVRAQAGAVTYDFTSTVTGGTGGGGGGGGGDKVARIVMVSGNGQLRGLFDTITANPLVVQVLDADDNPIAGKEITWTQSGGANFIPGGDPVKTTTGPDGLTSVNFILGGYVPIGSAYNTYLMTANTTDLGSVTFTATGYPPPTGPFIPMPTLQLIKPGQGDRTLTVKLGAKTEDAIESIALTVGGNGSTAGQGVPGIGLTVHSANIDPTAGPVAKCDGTTALSDEHGISRCDLLTSGRTGQTRLFVDIGGGAANFFVDLTVTPGDPVAPVIVQGDNQSGKPGATLPVALKAKVVDSFGNPLPATPVTWSLSTAGSMTLINVVNVADANGYVSTGVILGPTAGKYQVKVAAGGNSTSFQVTVESLATGLVKVSGDNQPVVPILQPFPQPLVVKVTAAGGVGVAGATVNWTVNGSATLSATSSTTGTDGTAKVNVTAGAAPGTITVTAAVTGLTSVSFTLQSRLPGPSLTTASFVNYATGANVLAPGNLVLIVGAGLAPNITGQIWADPLDLVLPLELRGVSVRLTAGGVTADAPIYRIANENGVESVLIQVPFELFAATADVTVNVSGGSTKVTGVPMTQISPGILEDIIEGRRAAIVLRPNGSRVSPSNPALQGETVRLFSIGLGQTSPTLLTNRVGIPNQSVLATIAVGINNAGVEVVAVNAAQNLVGIYEVDFVVPIDAATGPNQPLGFIAQAAGGQPVYGNGSVISIGPAPAQ